MNDFDFFSLILRRERLNPYSSVVGTWHAEATDMRVSDLLITFNQEGSLDLSGYIHTDMDKRFGLNGKEYLMNEVALKLKGEGKYIIEGKEKIKLKVTVKVKQSTFCTESPSDPENSRRVFRESEKDIDVYFIGKFEKTTNDGIRYYLRFKKQNSIIMYENEIFDGGCWINGFKDFEHTVRM